MTGHPDRTSARRRARLAVVGALVTVFASACGPADEEVEVDVAVLRAGHAVSLEAAAERARMKDVSFRTTRQIAQMPLPEGHSYELGPAFVRGPADEDDVGPYVSIELAEDSLLLRVPAGVEVEGADDAEALALVDDAVAWASRFVVEEVVDSDVFRTSRPEAHDNWFVANRWRFSSWVGERIDEMLEEGDGLPVHRLVRRDPDDPDDEPSGPVIYSNVIQPDEPRRTNLTVEVTDVSFRQMPDHLPQVMVEHELSYGRPQCGSTHCTSLEIVHQVETRQTMLYRDGDVWYINGILSATESSDEGMPEQPDLEPFSWSE